MLTVHHLENSRSQRVLWLLEELGVEYDIRHYARDARTLRAPAELRRVHPLGKSPVISDDELVVAESGTILEYLVSQYGEGRLRGSDPLRYSFWMHYAEGSLMPPLFVSFLFTIIPRRMPFFVRWFLGPLFGGLRRAIVDGDLRRHLGFIEDSLGESLWLAGDELSAADVQMSFPLEVALARGPAGQYPRIEAFVRRMRERPAFQRALARGGPYTILR